MTDQAGHEAQVQSETLPDSPAQIYNRSLPALKTAELAYHKLVAGIVAPVAGEHYTISRVKGARSLIRKLRKDPGAVRTWQSITDKVGVRVICSTKRDCKAVDAAIRAHSWASQDPVKKTGPTNTLFYAGIHNTVYDGEFVDALGEPILCEVQIRTRAQDAWSVVDHKLLYKGLITPPRRVQRVIRRLTAVVEIFDDEVQRMFKKRESLPQYELARAVEYLDDKYEALLGEPGGAPTDLHIIRVLWDAYTPDERPRFREIIDEYVSSRASLAADVLAHQPDSPAYIDGRDWLSTQPEVLAVLERATHRESLLADAIRGTDLEDIVRKTCDSYHIVLND